MNDDKSYYEIQLEQKQLVLILLLMVGICVLFFFLGVYYVKGREPVGLANGSAARDKTGTDNRLTPPESPDKLETEKAANFFETGGSKETAPKADYEGGKVVAESIPTDPGPRGDRKSATKEPKPPDAGEKSAATPKTAPSTPPKLREEPKAPVTPPPERVTKPRGEEPKPAAGEGFIVQIGAMKDLDRANKVRDELKSKGFPAFVDTQDGGGGEKLYKIRVGPFAERSKADKAKDGLKSQGYGGAFVSGE